MTALKIPGLNRTTSRGKVYYYHRATGVRIKASPDDLTAFVAEVAALNAVSPPRQKPEQGSLGSLIVAYKTSPEWSGLAPDTHKSYERVFSYLKEVAGLKLDTLTPAMILQIRDKAFAKHQRWFANMTVKVLSVVLGWGVPRGWLDANVAKGVPTIRRSRRMGVANAAWMGDEVATILAASSGGLRKAIALAYYCGLRKMDVVSARRADRRGDRLEIASSKPGMTIGVYVSKQLAAILDEPDPIAGMTIVVTRRGQPFTRDGLDTMFDRLKRRLASEGQIRTGLTFHGLRKSLGRDAADEGFSENDIAGALGQRNPASARPYTIERNQRAAADRVLKRLEQKGKR